MIQFNFDKHCTGCSVCADACPKSCINIQCNKYGIRVPKVTTNNCLNCGICEKVCPVLNPLKKQFNERKLYCAFNMNNEDRRKGSSGSMMLLLAREIIGKGGVVYGASFTEELKVVHTRADKIADVYSQCKSKYIQSDTRGIYRAVKSDLGAGKIVMFVGTPCQCQACNNYVGSKYREQLLLVDFLCHGVPSQELFDRCVESYEKKNICKIKNFNFREKVSGYPHNFKAIIDKAGIEYTIIAKSSDFPFYSAFREYFIFRESCYECKFVGMDRITDFTLGDFWGVQKDPQYRDFYENGYSQLYVNSKKGKELLGKLSNKVFLKEYSFNSPKAINYAYLKPTEKSLLHDWFMYDYSRKDFATVEKRFLNAPFPLWIRICRKIIKIIK